MMNELDLLRALILFGVVVAPLGTHRLLLAPSKLALPLHAAAVVSVALGLLVPLPLLCVPWLLFCAFNFGLYLWQRARTLRSAYVLASCIPFLFSNIAAVWIVGGANELHILGYSEMFSYYAALHGIFLGWIFVGAITILGTQERRYRPLYLGAAVVCLVSFLLIAFGIDGLAVIKPIGVAGLSFAIPSALLAFVKSTWSVNKVAASLACVSLLGLAFTMTLAWQNEFGIVSLPFVVGVAPMASVHGLLNGVIVAPSFMLAVVLETRRLRSASATPKEST